MHLLLLLHATFRGIFDEELGKKSLSSSGLLRDSAKGKALGGHREMLPDRATWALEQGSSRDREKGSVIYQSKVGNEAVKGVS